MHLIFKIFMLRSAKSSTEYMFLICTNFDSIFAYPLYYRCVNVSMIIYAFSWVRFNYLLLKLNSQCCSLHSICCFIFHQIDMSIFQSLQRSVTVQRRKPNVIIEIVLLWCLAQLKCIYNYLPVVDLLYCK